MSDVERRRLYDAGLSDSAVGDAVGVPKWAIQKWRLRLKLPGNKTTPNAHLKPDQDRARRALHAEGLSDSDIAKREGISPYCVLQWRQRRGLKPNFGVAHFCPEQHAARMLLYALGYSDVRIAREQHMSPSPVRRWRERLGLRPNIDRTRGKIARKRRHADHILGRVKRAIGRLLPADIADDAAGDLYLALLEGRVTLENVEAEARKHGNRVLGQYASKFGPRSIDQAIAGTEDLRLIDTLIDESSRSWLEEMGATVW